jgi:hypothetical protein
MEVRVHLAVSSCQVDQVPGRRFQRRSGAPLHATGWAPPQSINYGRPLINAPQRLLREVFIPSASLHFSIPADRRGAEHPEEKHGRYIYETGTPMTEQYTAVAVVIVKRYWPGGR